MISPNEIAGTRSRMGLTQQEFARCVGVTRQSVSNWETGRERPSKPVEKALRALVSQYPLKDGEDGLSASARELRSFYLSLETVKPEVVRRDEDGAPRGFVPGRVPDQTFALRALGELAARVMMSDAMLPIDGAVGPYAAPVPPLAILSPLAKLGAQYSDLPRLNDEQALPVITADPTTYYLNEDEAVGFSDPTIASADVTTATLGCATRLTRVLMRKAAAVANIEGTVAAAQLRVISNRVAKDAITGDGVGGAPTGLLNVGLGNTNLSTFAVAELNDIMEILETAEADPAYFGAIIGPARAKVLRNTPVVTGSDQMMLRRSLASPTGLSLNGLPAVVLNGMAADKIILGDFSRLHILTDSTFDQRAIGQDDTAGGLSLYAFLNFAVQVPHTGAFHTVTIV